MSINIRLVDLDPELLRIVLDLAQERLEQQTCAPEDSIGRLAVERVRQAITVATDIPRQL